MSAIPTYAALNHGVETDAAGMPVFRSSVRVIDPLWILAGLVVVVLLWQRR